MKNALKVAVVLIALMFVATIATSLSDEMSHRSSNRIYQHAIMADPSENSHVNGAFNTKLPIVSLSTNGQVIPGVPITNENAVTVGYTKAVDGTDYILCQAQIFDTPGAYNHLTDEPVVSGDIMFRLRGNSSRYFDKKSYKLMFVDDEGLERNVAVMGMESHDEWALYGPYLDKTLLRNYISLNIYGELDPYTPDVRYCEVYLDGDYQGLYLMMETVSAGQGRIDLTSYKTRSDATSYLVRLDKEWEEETEFETFSYYSHNLEFGSKFDILYPGNVNVTDTFKRYIADDISRFEKALYSFDFDDPVRGYKAYIDVQSFVNYYIMCEFMCLNDMYSRSTYLYKTLGGELVMGPGWDYNNAWDGFIALGFDGDEFLFSDRGWFDRLLKDEYFVNMVVGTYRQMRDGGVLSEDNLLDVIDDTIAFLGDSIERNYDVWGYSFDPKILDNYQKLRPDYRNSASYRDAVQQLKDFITVRGRWMDENIHILYQYCHPSRTKQYRD